MKHDIMEMGKSKNNKGDCRQLGLTMKIEDPN